VDKAHREELKHDKFVEQVGHTVEYAVSHKSLVTRAGAAVLAVLVIGFGAYFYLQYQENARQAELQAAFRIQEAPVGDNEMADIAEFKFKTADERTKALEKALRDIVAKYPSKREGYVAKFLLATTLADRGSVQEAEKLLRDVADNANGEYASQAKLSLGMLLAAQDRAADAEKILRELVNSPTMMVSKEQATLALARAISKTKPEEARKLLEPLRGHERSTVSRNVLTTISELPAAK
jgi:hypothetical protein